MDIDYSNVILFTLTLYVLIKAEIMYIIYHKDHKWMWMSHWGLLHPYLSFDKDSTYSTKNDYKIGRLVSTITGWLWLISTLILFKYNTSTVIKVSTLLYVLTFISYIMLFVWENFDDYIKVTDDTLDFKQFKKNIQYITPGLGFGYMIIIGYLYYKKIYG